MGDGTVPASSGLNGRIRGRRYIKVAAALLAAGLAATGCSSDPSPPAQPPALTEVAPKNPWLAESEYPITHFNSAATDSTGAAGPAVAKELSDSDIKYVPITYSSNPTVKYSGGDRIVFAPSMFGIQKILATGEEFEPIDFLPYPGYTPPSEADLEGLLGKADTAATSRDDAAIVGLGSQADAAGLTYEKIPNGAYNMIDKDGYHYSVIEGMRVLKMTDDERPRGAMRFEKVAELKKAALPDGLSPQVRDTIRNSKSQIVAMGMTFDGQIVAGSDTALFFMDRDLNVRGVFPFSNESLDNNIAVDESGIYAVTSRRMLKIVWTGSDLSIAEEDGGWSSEYATSDPAVARAAGSLTRSGGSGTTPTLMGFGPGEDKLVIISDANPSGPNLVAFWRDEIPATGDEGGSRPANSRIAGQVKVDVSKVTLELSPTAMGQDVLATTTAYPEPAPNVLANIFAPGVTRPAPHGMQKFRWNSVNRSFDHVWTNEEVDNSDITVPAVSSATGLLYAASKRDGRYEYLGIDWNTGDIVARWPFPDDSRRWNLFGGMVTPLGDGQLLSGGMFSIKRISVK